MISVITATRNRHHELRWMLESLQVVTPPSCEWEVVVVDNNSADATAAVLPDVEREGRLPLRRLFEERIGKTLACNQAIRDRLWHAEERTVYVPDALVHHPVDPSRLHRRYAIRWSHHVGRTSARMRARPPGARVANRVRVYLFRMLASDVLALARAGVSGSPAERQRRLQEAAARLGPIREMIGLPLNFDPTRHVPALDAPAPAIRGGRAQG